MDLLFLAEELKGDLDRYVQAELQGKVRVLRNQRREGLIRGRMIGAAQASGKAWGAVKAPRSQLGAHTHTSWTCAQGKCWSSWTATAR